MNELIKELFEKTGLSNADIMEKTGISATNFPAIISNPPRHNISIKKAKEIAEKLGYIIEMKVGEKPKVEKSVFECGCKIENGLFRRDKNCKKEPKDH